MSSSCEFIGRYFISEVEVLDYSIWVYELEPMCMQRRDSRSWVVEHMDCYTLEDLRKLFSLPETGAYQVLFKGTLTGGKTWSLDGEDWDEELDVTEVKSEEIPKDYLDAIWPERKRRERNKAGLNALG